MTQEQKAKELAIEILEEHSRFYSEVDANSLCRKLCEAGCYAESRKQNESATDICVGNKSEWISVDERLPKEGVEVLVALKFHDHLSVDTDRLYGGRWFAYGEMRGVKYVTHWMPFPEHPKVKGGGE